MQDKLIYEYAIIRFVPRVDREEFLNVGVLLYCARLKFLDFKYNIDSKKISTLFDSDLIVELENCLKAIELIARGVSGSQFIGELDIASRFRWLTATRSTIIQTSKVHVGLCDNLNECLKKLYEDLVL